MKIFINTKIDFNNYKSGVYVKKSKRRYLLIPYLFLIFSCLFGASQALCANNIVVKSNVDKLRALMGEHIKYTLTVSRKEGISVEMPALGANLGNFDIKDYNISKPEEKDGMVIEKHVYIIVSFELGKSEIPSFNIKYKSDGEKEKVIPTEKIMVDIVSTPKKEMKDIIDVKAPIEKQFEWGAIKRSLLITFVLICIILLGLFIYKKLTKKADEQKNIEPDISPEEWALSLIERLEDSSMLADGRVKDYYDFLSDVIRRFFERLHGVELMELTTSEFKEKLGPLLSKTDQEGGLNSFLDDCDMVKFADDKPEEAEVKEISNRARDIVRATVPTMPVIVGEKTVA